MFQYDMQNDDGKLIVSLGGDLDIEATEIIEEELIEKVLYSTGAIELDFRNIDFVDSSGIGLLITLVTSLRDNDRVLSITNLKEDVRMVFELLQLDEILGKDVVVL